MHILCLSLAGIASPQGVLLSERIPVINTKGTDNGSYPSATPVPVTLFASVSPLLLPRDQVFCLIFHVFVSNLEISNLVYVD